jgi:hypothetical protein
MKCSGITIGTLLVAMVGCDTSPNVRDRSSVNAWLMSTVRNSAIENAIIAQHTLYPYHFVANSDMLNNLGESDLGVLATHYRLHPGKLNIRRGETPEDLYKARVKLVVEKLAEEGVDTDRVTVEDALPGGDGISSERALLILSSPGEPGQTQMMPTRGMGASTREGVTRTMKGVR